ncbi:MAG: glycosyltransferase family protein [Rhodospirillales bacterium]
MSPPSVLFYAQHLQGVGHLIRAARIAKAMTTAGLDVDLVSGGMPVPGLDKGDARLHQLPPLQCPDGDFTNLRDERGELAGDAFIDQRRDALLTLLRERRPAALVIEAFPFGRRRMRFELTPLLAEAASADPKPVIACSVRDILQADKKPGRAAETVAAVNDYFDAVLVHGDPGFAAFEETFPGAGEIAGKLHYTGLVAGPAPGPGPDRPAPDRPERGVLVSAGGGATESEKLLRAALAARPLSSLGDRPWRLLAGPNLPEGEFAALAAGAADTTGGVTVEPNRDDFPQLLAGCAVSVSQAGYNTAAALLRARCRAVVVPYSTGGETEQTFRAKRMQKRGLAHVVPDTDLAPETLAAAIDAAFVAPAPAPPDIAFDGAETSARLVASWLAA